MNKQIDRMELNDELRQLFHNHNELFKPDIGDALLDLFEEKTDKSYMNGVQDLMVQLANEHEITVIMSEDNNIAYIGQISEDFEDDIEERKIENE